MQSDQRKLEICHHEAGHWVIAQAVGFEVDDITVTLFKDGKHITASGSATVFPRLEIKSVEAVEEYLVKRIVVLFSGVISESIAIENRNEFTARELLKTNGIDDARSANELLQILRGVRFPGRITIDESRQLAEVQTECWQLANALIEENQDKIRRVARGMALNVSALNKPVRFRKVMLQEFSVREHSGACCRQPKPDSSLV
ncbi:hypothetical protein [Ideonella margarita]|uniref:Peptidase M41 domain-containing protein n=1 Tax=Ideonella margarita TaxID=2984191 RepID=A0ABU9C8P5_9BURK